MTTRQLELTKAATKTRRATRPRGQAIPIPEANVQAAIIERLTWAGYLVLSTSRIRRGVRCACGKFSVPQGGDGVSKGVPDILISHNAWPKNMWVALEVKGSHTPLSVEQKTLVEAGRYCIVRDQDEAHRLVCEAEFAILGRNYGRNINA